MAKDLGSQSDRTMNKQVKPVAPDCSGYQFAENPYSFQADQYFDVSFDKDNNPLPDDTSDFARNATAREGKFGTLMYADAINGKDLGTSGEAQFFGPEDAKPGVSTVWVDIGRADRGKDY